MSKIMLLQWGQGWHAEMLHASQPIHTIWAHTTKNDSISQFDDIPQKTGKGMTYGDKWGWTKIYVIKRLIRQLIDLQSECTHILWLDSDAIIQKTDADIRTIIDSQPDKDIFARKVGNFVLAGVMVLKVSEHVHDALQKLWDSEPVGVEALGIHVHAEMVRKFYYDRYSLTEEIALTLAGINGELLIGDLPAIWHDCNPERDSSDSASKDSIIRHYAVMNSETKLRRIQKAARKYWEANHA